MQLPIEIIPSGKIDQEKIQAELDENPPFTKKRSITRIIVWIKLAGIALLITYFLDWTPKTGKLPMIWLGIGILCLLTLPLLMLGFAIWRKIVAIKNKKQGSIAKPNEAIQKITFREDAIEMIKVHDTIIQPWSKVKQFIEYESFILIVPEKKGFIISKNDMSTEALTAINTLVDQWPNIEKVKFYSQKA